MKRYLEYLDEYCTHFALWKYIELNTRVKKLRRKGAGHVITFKKRVQSREGTQEESWECDAVAICTGLHVEPHMPQVEGIDYVPIVIHSSKFKGKSDFGEDKNIVVLGVGETGMDIAHLAVTSPSPRSVTICHRRGFLGGPKIRTIRALCSFPLVLTASLTGSRIRFCSPSFSLVSTVSLPTLALRRSSNRCTSTLS